jgi:hypothetical protein
MFSMMFSLGQLQAPRDVFDDGSVSRNQKSAMAPD